MSDATITLSTALRNEGRYRNDESRCLGEDVVLVVIEVVVLKSGVEVVVVTII